MDLFLMFYIGFGLFFALFALTWAVFGKLIRTQIKRWLLKSKGYVELEYVSDTRVRTYFIVKPKESKFDLNDGFFHYIPECITKAGDIIRPIDKEFFSKVPDVDLKDLEGLSDKEQEEFKARIVKEWSELKNLYKVISKLNYDSQQLTSKYGMPVITYSGDNPDPINFSDRKKSYGSGVIKDMYLRLLLTQRYKDFKLIIMAMLVIGAIFSIAGVMLAGNNSGLVKTVGQCLVDLNVSNSRYADLVNQSLTIARQGSSVVVGG